MQNQICWQYNRQAFFWKGKGDKVWYQAFPSRNKSVLRIYLWRRWSREYFGSWQVS